MYEKVVERPMERRLFPLRIHSFTKGKNILNKSS